jgi:hypothetical protein
MAWRGDWCCSGGLFVNIKYDKGRYLYDGVPNVAGGRLSTEKWLKMFRKEIGAYDF